MYSALQIGRSGSPGCKEGELERFDPRGVKVLAYQSAADTGGAIKCA
jgi:hypothetical protein